MDKTGQHILFIDDHRDILEANRSYFAEHGFAVTACDNGAEALSALEFKSFDCIVLDVSMPDMDGYEVCREVRKRYNMPIIFLSCLDKPDDKIRGLMLGGDVYMTKPYDLRVLHAQVLACLRRDNASFLHAGKIPLAAKNSIAASGDFSIDTERRIVRFQEHCAVLSKKEMALLLALLEQPGKTVGKNILCSTLWPGEVADESRLQSLVRNLRRKVEFASVHLGQLENIYGVGYRLNMEEEL